MQSERKLAGKVAIITGSSRGIGASVAKKFASEGCHVAIVFREDREGAERIRREIVKLDGNAEIFQCDVSKREEVYYKVNEILTKFGKVDILVNNAGKMILGDVLSAPVDSLKTMMETNVYAGLYFIQALADVFKSNGGSIINIASNAGIGTALEGYTYYSISKAALISLTKRLAFDLRDYGVRENASAPGTIDTELITKGKTDDEVSRLYSSRISTTILKRIGKPEDIASVALFLASEDSSFITSQVIVVDGGRFDYLSHGL